MDSAVDRLITLKVKDVMTRNVVCVDRDQPLTEAAALFVEKRVSGAPVVDADGRCVGVLSALDYVKREDHLQKTTEDGSGSECVSDRMSKGVRFVRPDQTLLTAARLMCVQHVHRLPVLDADGRTDGVITSMDVVAALVNAIDEREAAAL